MGQKPQKNTYSIRLTQEDHKKICSLQSNSLTKGVDFLLDCYQENNHTDACCDYSLSPYDVNEPSTEHLERRISYLEKEIRFLYQYFEAKLVTLSQNTLQNEKKSAKSKTTKKKKRRKPA